MIRHPPRPTLFPYTPLFRSPPHLCHVNLPPLGKSPHLANPARRRASPASRRKRPLRLMAASVAAACPTSRFRFPRPSSAAVVCACWRSEEHTSELQSPCNLVCRLLLEKKKI